jgi:hypothetical protein
MKRITQYTRALIVILAVDVLCTWIAPYNPFYDEMVSFWISIFRSITSVASAQYQTKPPLGAQLDWSNPINKSLVGCWVFNEGSGNLVRDLSGNGRDGTLTGATRRQDWIDTESGSKKITLPTPNIGPLGTILFRCDGIATPSTYGMLFGQ